MSTNIIVQVPDSLRKYHRFLQDFFDKMVYKLHKNAHKETPAKESLQKIMDLLIEEIIEFENQIAKDKFNENSLIELADQANFAFLAYVALRLEGVKHADQGGNTQPSGG
jgi:hypothetical protein